MLLRGSKPAAMRSFQGRTRGAALYCGGMAASLASNNAGISGVTAAKTAGANSITLATDVVSGNAVVNSGSDFIATTIGDAATSSIAISATDVAVGSATSAAYADGDAYTFEVAGHELSLIIDTSDGYTDDHVGVAQQMAD